MLVMKTIKIRSHQMGLHFRDGEFQGLLSEGRHRLFDPLCKVQVDAVSMRHARQLVHDRLDVIVKSGALADRAIVLDLKDHQRALVWVEGRFSHVLSPGLYAYWTALRDIRTEIVDARKVRFEHDDLSVILRSQTAERLLDSCQIEQGHVGVLFKDGEYVETLSSGRYAFWKDVAKVSVVRVDMRETIVDVGGQEIMTADKVTLRLNALVTYLRRLACAPAGQCEREFVCTLSAGARATSSVQQNHRNSALADGILHSLTRFVTSFTACSVG